MEEEKFWNVSILTWEIVWIPGKRKKLHENNRKAVFELLLFDDEYLKTCLKNFFLPRVENEKLFKRRELKWNKIEKLTIWKINFHFSKQPKKTQESRNDSQQSYADDEEEDDYDEEEDDFDMDSLANVPPRDRSTPNRAAAVTAMNSIRSTIPPAQEWKEAGGNWNIWGYSVQVYV